ncbi:calcium/proton exchanger [Auriscalpium vulgare]|uniref:Calcium/proton exchanger n=1 Tax=Auriscalpium vulgare TaxID=40419 RepID=A0ACB8SD82_9AGAM|nr:calcium/proton exchanger [Auriscalpium vulgare]
MSASESTPLLPNGTPKPSPLHRLVAFVKADGEPGWIASYKWFLFSWVNLLLVLVPLAFAAHFGHWDAALRFSFSFLAIVPLAKLLGDATEQMSLSLGQTLAGLLNATFGNAVEIIVGVSALLQGQIRIVQTSMLGSILSNLLLVLGCSFLAAGIKFSESEFQVTAAQTYLMTLACITLVIPAAYHSARASPASPVHIPGVGVLSVVKDPRLADMDEQGQSGLLIISRGTAILLLGVYIAYLFFQLKTHAALFIPKSPEASIVTTDVEAQPPLEEEPEEVAEMSVAAAAAALLSVTIMTSFVADILVSSIEETATRYDIPKAFIGLILLPLVANAAEHVTSVWMAMKNKMELTIGISVGSSIQIATFVVPLLVIIGWISGHELTLFFDNFETVAFFVSVLLVNLLIQDGKSNYMEGLMLVTLYLVIALACKSCYLFCRTAPEFVKSLGIVMPLSVAPEKASRPSRYPALASASAVFILLFFVRIALTGPPCDTFLPHLPADSTSRDLESFLPGLAVLS